MFRNYLKIAFRNLVRERRYSGINVVGLSLGAAVAILIFLYVQEEWSFDQFHSKHERIYRAWVKEQYKGQEFFNSVTPFVLGTELAANFPEVESVVQYMTGAYLARHDEFVDQERVHVATPSFLQVFDFPLIAGQASTALDDPADIVLTEELARKFFQEPAPLGKNLDLQVGGEWRQFQVSGIIADAPSASSIRYDMLISFEITRSLFSERAFTSWTNVIPETYILLREGANLAELEAKLQPFLDKQVPEAYAPGEYQVGFQPLTDIHLNDQVPGGIADVSDWRYPYILAAIAALVLLLASINYITLAVGRSVARAKEVGVRKVTGATRRQLMLQFWSEAILLALIAVGFGILIAELTLPAFNELSGKSLAVNYSGIAIPLLLGLSLLIGLLAGVYPALLLSGFSPLRTLRGAVAKAGTDKHLVLRGLVGSQFVLSVGLIICAVIMQQQLRYLQHKNLGFDRDQLLTLPYAVRPSNDKGIATLYQEGLQLADRLESELAGTAGVRAVTASTHTLGTPGWMRLGFTDPQDKQFKQFYMVAVRENFLPTHGIDFVAGRNFSPETGTDATQGLIINRAMADAFGWSGYLDQPLPAPFESLRLVGITENFHFASLHTEVAPLAIVRNPLPVLEAVSDVTYGDLPTPKMTFKLEGGGIPEAITAVQSAWKSVAPDQPFNYSFVDDDLRAQYEAESRLGRVLSIATLLAILIAGLGLFGIATLTAARRTKEIGVRKVLGASALQIVLLLNRSYTGLVIAATLIAAPLSWYLMRQWLADFTYRIGINPLVFVAAGLLALAVAWLAVSYQSLRAARRNPVESLRYE